MSVGLVAIVLLGVAGIVAFFTLIAMLDINSSPDAPLGPWRAPRPKDAAPPSLPQEFETLIQGIGTRRPATWTATVEHLDRLEQAFGGTVPEETPPHFDEAWLDLRLQRIEELAGPMPYPMPPNPKPKRTSLWSRLFS